MTTSMLEFVSDVLIKLGEGVVDSVDRNEASRLAARNTVFAVRALADEHPYWPWMHSDYTAESWLGQIATLPDGVVNLSYVHDRGSGQILRYVPEKDFERFTYNIFNSYIGPQGGAEHYTLKGGKVWLNPYPLDAEARNNILFNAAVLPGTRATDSEIIPVADRDLNCLLFRVCMMMAVDHLKDTNLAQVYMLEYQQAVRAAKARMVTDNSDARRSMVW